MLALACCHCGRAATPKERADVAKDMLRLGLKPADIVRWQCTGCGGMGLQRMRPTLVVLR